MTMRTFRLPLWLGLSALGLGACGGGGSSELDEKLVTQNAALHTRAVMRESGLALGFTVADDGTLSKIMGSSSTTANSVVAPALSGGMPPTSMLRAMVGPDLTQQLTGMQMLPSMLTPEEQFDQAGEEISRLMKERLFVDANFESKANGVATYLLHGDPTCRPLSQDSDPVGTVPPIDQKCADDFAKVAVRIAVKADGDGAHMTALIGDDRLELITVIFHSDEIAVELDLAKAKAASDLLKEKVGDGAVTGTYARLAGKIRGSLKNTGPQKVTASFSILAAIDVAPMGGGSFTSAASSPLWAVTSNGVAKTAELQIGLGATKITATWDPQGTGVQNEDFQIVSGGLYGKVSLQENAQQVLLTDVGIGQTKMVVRGTTIMDLNLNPNSMRRFSGKATVSAAGISRVEVTPQFDFSLAFDYNAIAADFSTPPPATLAHETYTVSLANGGAPVIIEEAPATATFTGGVKIVAGTLAIGVASVPAETVNVGSGQCLSATETAAAGTHELLGTLVVSDCP